MEDDQAAAKIIAELLVQLNSVEAPGGLRRLREVAAVTVAVAPRAAQLIGDAEKRRLSVGSRRICRRQNGAD